MTTRAKLNRVAFSNVQNWLGSITLIYEETTRINKKADYYSIQSV